MAWPVVTYLGEDYYQSEGITLVPVKGTGVALVMLKKDGGVVGGASAIAQGDPGVHAELDNVVVLTELAATDPTLASASFTTMVPPTTTTPGKWRLNLSLHRGVAGADGTVTSASVLAAASASPTAGYLVAAKSDLSGVELVPVKVPEVFYPGTVNNVASGNANYTMAQINIPARPYARRVQAFGHNVIVGEAADVRVDLIARLNGETGGNIVGRCPGVTQTERLQFSPGRAAGLADTYDQIAANASAVLYIRTERQAGTSTYTASASVAQFEALVLPL